jgi:hypothetical protein
MILGSDDFSRPIGESAQGDVGQLCETAEKTHLLDDEKATDFAT